MTLQYVLVDYSRKLTQAELCLTAKRLNYPFYKYGTDVYDVDTDIVFSSYKHIQHLSEIRDIADAMTDMYWWRHNRKILPSSSDG